MSTPARTKAMGPIPPAFTGEGGMLLIGGIGAAALAEEAGETPLFVYDAAMLSARVASLRAVLPARCDIHYAMKANPFAPLLRHLAPLVDGLDIASSGEMEQALAAGIGPEHISFAGPGKRDAELRAALDHGVTVHLESEGEARRLLAIADGTGVTPRVAVRVNPDFDLKGSGMRMGGGAKPFGVDADRAAPLARAMIDAGCDWRGWHIFAGSQSLDGAAIIAMQAATVALAASLSETVGSAPPLVNLGGGFGIPYFPGDTALFPEMDGLVPELDLALIPIWGWGPTLGRGAHMDPEQGAEALALLRPRIAVPIHWGTYAPVHLGLRRQPAFLAEPQATFVEAAAREAPGVDVRVLAPGEALEL